MREVHLAGITPEPNGPWMKQVARNLTAGSAGFLNGYRYLLHDRASLFSAEFRMRSRAGAFPKFESVRRTLRAQY